MIICLENEVINFGPISVTNKRSTSFLQQFIAVRSASHRNKIVNLFSFILH